MKRILLSLICLLALTASAQTVTKTRHQKAVKTDVVTTGTLTVRKPDYMAFSTDGGRDIMMMEGTRFTITLGGRQHTTDSRKNPQFATFQAVLHAVINGQPIPANCGCFRRTHRQHARQPESHHHHARHEEEAPALHLVRAHRRCQDIGRKDPPHERSRRRLYGVQRQIRRLLKLLAVAQVAAVAEARNDILMLVHARVDGGTP